MHHASRTAASSRARLLTPSRGDSTHAAFLPSPLAWVVTRAAPTSTPGGSARPTRSPVRALADAGTRPYSSAAASLGVGQAAPRRGLLDWLSETSRGRLDSAIFGLALEDALTFVGRPAARSSEAIRRPNKSRRYPYTLSTVTVEGRSWTQQSLLEAYSTFGFPIESVERAIECSSAAMLGDASVVRGAGASLPEVLQLLDVDNDLFVTWQNVLTAPDVRSAVSLIEQQTSPGSMSPDGLPLWPPWLLMAIVDRAATVAEGHLAIAAIAHHLPFLWLEDRSRFILKTVQIAARLNMVTALPVLIDLALKLPPAEAHQQRRYFNQLIAQFNFPRTHRNANQPLVNAQVVRILDAMEACKPAVALRQSTFNFLFRPMFLSTPELHDLLLLCVKRDKLEWLPQHLFVQLQRASFEEDGETAHKCLEALHAAQKLDSMKDAVALEADDASPAHFCAGSARFLKALSAQPEEALAYYRTLRRPPPPVELADQQSANRRRRWWEQSVDTTALEAEVAERQCWAILVQIFVRWHKTMPIEDIIEMVGPQSADAPVPHASVVCTIDAAMHALLHLGRKDDFFTLWRQAFEDDGLAPSGNSLVQFVWACNLDMTPDRALIMLDHWSVRVGVHEVVTKTPEQTVDVHFATQVVRNGPDTPPVQRVQLDAYSIQKLMSSFHELGGQSTILLRVWRASEVRWGVAPTSGMLDELLMSTAYARWKRVDNPKSPAFSVQKDYYTGSTLADDVDWAWAPTRAFLQSPALSEAEPWLESRRIFETIHLSNWPELATVPHPFDEIHGDKLSPSLVTLSTTSVALNAEVLRQGLPPAFETRVSGLPSPSLYSSIAPTAESFHAYILLLMRHNFTADIPIALAWMRARKIVPHQKTLHIAVDALYRTACEGPLWHFVVTDGIREDDPLCQEENVMFEVVPDLGAVGYIRKRRTKRPDLELIDWLATWCAPDIVPSESTAARKATRTESIHAKRSPAIERKPFTFPPGFISALRSS